MARLAIGVVVAACLALAACGAGQVSQTASQVAAVNGASGDLGPIRVRDAQFVWNGPVAGGAVYRPGQEAPLQLTIINDRATDSALWRTDRLLTGIQPGRRVRADQRRCPHPDRSGPHRGLRRAHRLDRLPRTSVVSITLVGLREPLHAGRTYPVDLTFERAGVLRLAVPVENPDRLPARADPA